MPYAPEGATGIKKSLAAVFSESELERLLAFRVPHLTSGHILLLR
jgi:hypothetical protein